MLLLCALPHLKCQGSGQFSISNSLDPFFNQFFFFFDSVRFLFVVLFSSRTRREKILLAMTLVSSLPQQQNQPPNASSTGANIQTDELRRRNVAETTSGGAAGLGGSNAIGDHGFREKEDKVKQKVMELHRYFLIGGCMAGYVFHEKPGSVAIS